jgi:hypothetical protein
VRARPAPPRPAPPSLRARPLPPPCALRDPLPPACAALSPRSRNPPTMQV